MYPILEPASAAGYGETTNPWRLDPNTLKFTTLKGNLPYDSELTQPQARLKRNNFVIFFIKDYLLSRNRLVSCDMSCNSFTAKKWFVQC